MFHGVSGDVQFRGHFIPKDAVVFVNLDSVASDQTIWGDVDNFRPERFLDKDGKVVKPDEFIPFSIGK